VVAVDAGDVGLHFVNAGTLGRGLHVVLRVAQAGHRRHATGLQEAQQGMEGTRIAPHPVGDNGDGSAGRMHAQLGFEIPDEGRGDMGIDAGRQDRDDHRGRAAQDLDQFHALQRGRGIQYQALSLRRYPHLEGAGDVAFRRVRGCDPVDRLQSGRALGQPAGG